MIKTDRPAGAGAEKANKPRTVSDTILLRRYEKAQETSTPINPNQTLGALLW